MVNRNPESPKAARGMWQHPDKPWLSLPRKTATVLAAIQSGFIELAEIAAVTGVSLDDVRRIERASDGAVRRVVAEGFPRGEFFLLKKRVRCPGCGGVITLVPCVACQSLRDRRRR